jgi:hypothetical protein
MVREFDARESCPAASSRSDPLISIYSAPTKRKGTMFNKGQLAGLMKQAQAMQDNLKKGAGRTGLMEVEGESAPAWSRC